jgi:hypothetical protein
VLANRDTPELRAKSDFLESGGKGKETELHQPDSTDLSVRMRGLRETRILPKVDHWRCERLGLRAAGQKGGETRKRTETWSRAARFSDTGPVESLIPPLDGEVDGGTIDRPR